MYMVKCLEHVRNSIFAGTFNPMWCFIGPVHSCMTVSSSRGLKLAISARSLSSSSTEPSISWIYHGLKLPIILTSSQRSTKHNYDRCDEALVPAQSQRSCNRGWGGRSRLLGRTICPIQDLRGTGAHEQRSDCSRKVSFPCF